MHVYLTINRYKKFLRIYASAMRVRLISQKECVALNNPSIVDENRMTCPYWPLEIRTSAGEV